MFRKRIRDLFKKVEGLQDAFLEFLAAFPDEASSRAHVLDWVLRAKPMICKSCGTLNRPQQVNDRKFRCLKCRKLIWITADTMFEQTEYFRPWVATFGFLEKGIQINPNQLHDLLEIPYFTANCIFKKISLKLKEQFLDNSCTVPSSLFVPIYHRRSRETPAGEPPVTEEIRAQEKAQKRADSPKMRQIPRPKLVISPDQPVLNETEKQIFETISATPISFDLLCEKSTLPVRELSAAVMSLELKEVVQRLPGDSYIRADFQSLVTSKSLPLEPAIEDKGIRASVKAINKYIRSCHGGASRKYVQLYVPLFLLHEGRKNWKDGTLLNLAINSKKVLYRDILAFVTDLQVSIQARAPDSLVRGSS